MMAFLGGVIFGIALMGWVIAFAEIWHQSGWRVTDLHRWLATLVHTEAEPTKARWN